MNIVHISAECFPAAKAGGLADVVGALPKYQNILGHKASVIMPHYYTKFRSENQYKAVFNGGARLGHHTYSFQVFQLLNENLGFDIYSIDIPGLFDRDKIYSYPDDTERFLTFQIAALNWLNTLKNIPDLVHCHDQHTGFIPFMMSKVWDYQRLKDIPTVFTIHNGQYQGQFGFDRIHYLPPFHSYFYGLVEWDGLINPLASAIKCAWKVTTVSPSYMDEIGYSMRGLESLLRAERNKSTGILNGIDNDVWNPETDTPLEKNYSIKTVESGKKANKNWLCKEFNLNPDLPLFIFIGRLVVEKGADIIPDVVYRMNTEHPGEQNILILGSGEPHIEQGLLKLEADFKGTYCSYIGYNEKLSHIMYAGADFILMPSRVEPCGLNQLYALRYGTVPVVRRTGGLKDTVIDLGDGGFGICHDQVESWDVINSINRAKAFFSRQNAFKQNRKTIMEIDHSWNRAAQEYLELYKTL
ncbi:MAG: glycogen synthase [Bacteroidetes bacterium HGW-Bacteroidetes-4]|jgi:starch synthase|nr:MAG: glycogen synthase [Bacteroidetes bacterium HGW-Bacteroidetes-4]